MEITSRVDLRVGDIATFTYQGHEFTGPLWTEGDGSLYVGAALFRFSDGCWFDPYEFVRATREAPALPTEPGSVIEITAIDENPIEPTLAMLDDESEWMLANRRDGGWALLAREITGWRPMKVVPA